MISGMIDRFKIAATLASPISTYAASRGIDARQVARACGLDPDQFGKLGARIGLDRFCRLLEALALLTDDPQFGLKAAAFFDKGSSGPFGYALLHAPTLRDALTLIERNMGQLAQTSVCSLKIGVADTRLEWTYSPLILRRDQYVDMGIALVMAQFRTILGADIDRIRLELEREKPKSTRLYREMLTRNLVFGAPINALIFPTGLLSRENPEADRRLFEILLNAMKNAAEEQLENADLATSVRLHVMSRLGRTTPTLASVAEHLNMGERTLQRRLSESNTSLQEIIDDGRHELAEKLLLNSPLNLSEIGFRLGFSAPSAFTRSATRWFGMSPSQFRRRYAGSREN